MTTTIFRKIQDTLDGKPAFRVEGGGEIPDNHLLVDHFPGGEWTAWWETEAQFIEAVFGPIDKSEILDLD